MIKDGSIENAVNLLEHLSRQISFKGVDEIEQKSKVYIKEAEFYLKAIETEDSSFISTALKAMINARISLIESIVSYDADANYSCYIRILSDGSCFRNSAS